MLGQLVSFTGLEEETIMGQKIFSYGDQSKFSVKNYNAQAPKNKTIGEEEKKEVSYQLSNFEGLLKETNVEVIILWDEALGTMTFSDKVNVAVSISNKNSEFRT